MTDCFLCQDKWRWPKQAEKWEVLCKECMVRIRKGDVFYVSTAPGNKSGVEFRVSNGRIALRRTKRRRTMAKEDNV